MNSSILTAAPRLFGAAALLGAMAIGASASASPDVPAETLDGVCAADAGVTVVVDFTDVGGEIEIGCAEGAPANGRAALETAGFVPEDSMPGMICAIDSSPDPCPEEFDGSFWSYWTVDDDLEWESYMVGADEASPAPGSIEGWRYFDGSAGPQVPVAVIAQTSQDAAQAPAEEAASEDAPSEDATTEDAEEGSSTTKWWFIAAAVAAVAAVITGVINRRKNLNS